MRKPSTAAPACLAPALLLPAQSTASAALCCPPRQIVSDLRTLRALGSYMLRFDPLTFLTYLDNLRATEGTKSVWLFHSGEDGAVAGKGLRVWVVGGWMVAQWGGSGIVQPPAGVSLGAYAGGTSSGGLLHCP